MNKNGKTRITRPLLFFGAAWELARFFILFTAATNLIISNIESQVLIMFLWFGSVQLVMSIAFFFAGKYPEKYASFINLLISGKVIGIFSGILFLFAQSEFTLFLVKIFEYALFANSEYPIVERIGISSLNITLPLFILLVAVLVLDFLLLVFLLLYDGKNKHSRKEITDLSGWEEVSREDK